ncbi:MAG: rhomboid family intramembrane serine protease [Verrucomicrobiales bacterium]|nr:rhomboid family intramembrane serine protease [Verrucomicrobiales bacterium]
MFLPYEIETLEQETPWMNWLIVALSSVVSLAVLYGGRAAESMSEALVLQGFSLSGMLGHVLLHGSILHLAGNMLFLWVFGNAICTNIGNWRYLGVFLGVTWLAALTHGLFDGEPAIGASGAVNGVVGMVLAMFPRNQVSVFWMIFYRVGTFQITAWVIIAIWLVLDLWGAFTGGGGIAYWAHVGGLLGGTAVGLLGLSRGWFRLTEYDNESLLEILQHPQETKA